MRSVTVKCDKCGEVLVENNLQHHYEVYRGDSRQRVPALDLCTDCHKMLKEWLGDRSFAHALDKFAGTFQECRLNQGDKDKVMEWLKLEGECR